MIDFSRNHFELFGLPERFHCDRAALDRAYHALQGEVHRLEKSSVGFDLQVAAGTESIERIRRKQDQIATERRSAEEELRDQQHAGEPAGLEFLHVVIEPPRQLAPDRTIDDCGLIRRSNVRSGNRDHGQR